mmetsp:Transcript_55861/g.92415  ORF Transcript_55861/g.92415 Transcript_55861/m.92415 type:complete len:87 (-) Transcript_55861:88-348(-)
MFLQLLSTSCMHFSKFSSFMQCSSLLCPRHVDPVKGTLGMISGPGKLVMTICTPKEQQQDVPLILLPGSTPLHSCGHLPPELTASS